MGFRLLGVLVGGGGGVTDDQKNSRGYIWKGGSGDLDRQGRREAQISVWLAVLLSFFAATHPCVQYGELWCRTVPFVFPLLTAA